MRCAVWFSNYGLPNVKLDLPYESRSPVLLTKVKYESKQDILDEVYRILQESNERNYNIGQSLYFQLPFFCNPSIIISDWCWDMITDYFTIKKYNVPLASSLDKVDSWVVDCFSVIDDEINKISQYERTKKDGS